MSDVPPKIKGFTTFGNRIIDLTPTQIQRTVAGVVVREQPQEIARVLEHKGPSYAARTTDRLRRPSRCSTHRLREHTADRTIDISEYFWR